MVPTAMMPLERTRLASSAVGGLASASVSTSARISSGTTSTSVVVGAPWGPGVLIGILQVVGFGWAPRSGPARLDVIGFRRLSWRRRRIGTALAIGRGRLAGGRLLLRGSVPAAPDRARG